MDECPIILAMLSIGMPASKVSVPKLWRAQCQVSGVRKPHAKPTALIWVSSLPCSSYRGISYNPSCSPPWCKAKVSAPLSGVVGLGSRLLSFVVPCGYIKSANAKSFATSPLDRKRGLRSTASYFPSSNGLKRIVP